MSELDKNRKKTNKIIDSKLKNSEKQLLTIYKGSLNNIRGQLLALNERSEWTLNELRKYDRLQKLQLEIYKEIKDVSLKTYNEIRRTNKDIFITNYNRSSYAITKEAGIFLDFSKLNAKKINAIVNMPYPNVPLKDFIKRIGSDTYEKLKVILGTNMVAGASLQNASKQIKDLLGVSYRKALTISRTEGLRASSKAQLEVTEQAIDKGLDVRKRWMSTLDMKTRESHAHMDGQLADKNGNFHIGIHTAPAPRMFGVGALDINCVLENTEVIPMGELEKGYKREYKGEILEIETASGMKLSITPNHPIFTRQGIIAGNFLKKGMYILSTRESKFFNIICPNPDNKPFMIKKIFSFDNIFSIGKRTLSINKEFHGDRFDGNIEIIDISRKLRNRGHSKLNKPIKKNIFSFSNFGFCIKSCLGFFCLFFNRAIVYSSLFISFLSKLLFFFKRKLIHSIKHRFRSISRSNIINNQSFINSISGYIKEIRKIFNGSSLLIEFDKIININRITNFSGHVYNLQTSKGCYCANNNINKINVKSFLVKNCRCTYTEEIEDISEALEKRMDNETKELIDNMTYDEWKTGRVKKFFGMDE